MPTALSRRRRDPVWAGLAGRGAGMTEAMIRFLPRYGGSETDRRFLVNMNSGWKDLSLDFVKPEIASSLPRADTRNERGGSKTSDCLSAGRQASSPANPANGGAKRDPRNDGGKAFNNS